ncbi:MAG TPA: metal-dependent hydrolase [Pyrinomonadaceae bacterium]|jgi:inner membrane protein
MDNLTHSLVGLAAAKAGLERLSPGATVVCVLAANAPDADILARLGGHWFYLQNHRGITHSIVGALALAVLLPALFYAGDLILASVRQRQRLVRLRGLLLASLIATASHPLLDWTNNYGLRPLLPWNGDWFYGDLVFIVDPWIWLALGGAAFLLTSTKRWQLAVWIILALVLTAAVLFLPLRNAGLRRPDIFRAGWLACLAGLILARRMRAGERWGRGLALAGLALVVVYWGGLSLAHRRALFRAQEVASGLTRQHGESPLRIAAMPTLADPLYWQCVLETNLAAYRFNLALNGSDGGGAPVNVGRFEKPQGREAELVARASEDERARIFLDFARFPATRVQGDCLSAMLVQFADLRYTDPGASRSGSFSLSVPVGCAEAVGEIIGR